VILIDANLLLYAHNSSGQEYEPARTWLTTVMGGPDDVRLAWPTVLAFVRIGTAHAIFQRPLTLEEATAAVTCWLDRPNVSILDPGERHWTILAELLRTAQARGSLVMDAHLAALTIEHGAMLYSTDRDFSRFPGLKWKNPLQP